MQEAISKDVDDAEMRKLIKLDNLIFNSCLIEAIVLNVSLQKMMKG